MLRATLLSAIAIGILIPLRARAFSDPALFADPAMMGGGGGRWFTGSATDRYTCKVCHRGGHDPVLHILGLPVAGYVPGTGYEITIEWPGDRENVALEAEFTDRNGHAAGGIRLPPQDELLPDEFCLPAAAGVGAGMLTELGTRTVISLTDCGARQLRVLWTTPAQDMGPLWLTGSVVSSNAKGDVEGDGVADFARALPSPSAPSAVAAQINAGCGVARLGHGDGGVASIVFAWLAWRRRDVRRGVRS